MKKIIYITLPVLIIILLGSFMLINQATEKSNIQQAFSNGNAVLLSKYFNTTVELELPDNDGNFSQKQAQIIMKNFFRKNPPKAYSVKQQGKSNDGSEFTIGYYKSTNSKIFRTYYLLKKSGGKYKLTLLQMEED